MVTAKSPKRINPREVLALNIKTLRAAAGLSQEDLALECELHRTFIAHVERGARNISLDNIEKIAATLDVPLAQLLTSPKKMVRKKRDS